MRHIFLLYLSIFLGGMQLQAQSPAELRAQLDQQEDDIAKVDLLIKYSKQFTTSSPKEGLSFAQDALNLARKLKRPDRGTIAYTNLGLVYMNTNQFTKAIEPIKAAIVLKKQLLQEDNAYNLALAKDYRYLGICYEKLNSPQALESYQQGFVFAGKAKDWMELATAKNSVGEVQFKLQRYGDAFRSFRQALEFADKANAKALTLEIEKNLTNTRTLLQKNQESEMEIELFQKQLEVIQDSLEGVKVTQEESVQIIDRLKMEQSATEAEIRAAKAELESKNKEIEVQNAQKLAREAEERNFWIGGGAVVGFLLILLMGQIRRSRTRKRANLALAAEKQKSDDLLRNILPVQVAEELKQKNKVTPVRHKEVSILFSDFKDFTAISSTLSPEALIAKLEEAFLAFDAIMDEFGLEKIKTIGDAYMAVSGLPNPDPNHAIHAVAAAMRMQEFMDVWLGKQKRRGESVWQLRIGINSGQVVAGVIGQKKFAYDIWGDAVNLASRMETHGEAGKVNISASTHKLVSGYCDMEPLRAVEIKNKGWVDTYFVKDIIKPVPPYREMSPSEIKTAKALQMDARAQRR